MKSTGCLLGSAIFAVASFGCGGDEAGRSDATGDAARRAEASVQRADDRSDRAADSAIDRGAFGDDASSAPRLESLSFSPDPPSSGGVVRALVRVANGGDGYELQYTWEVADRVLEDAHGAITLPALRKGDRIRVSVVATNAAGSSGALSAQTAIPNTPPKMLDLRLEEKTGPGGAVEAWEAQAWSQDPDGDPVEYEYNWFLNDRPTPVRSAEYPVGELSRGDRLRVRVWASDGEDEAPALDSGTLEVANTPPEIISTPPGLDPSGVYSYPVEAEDADGDRSLRFELVSGPRGMEMDPFSGELSWEPELDQAGRHVVEIAVDDRHGGRTTQEFLLPVVVRESVADGESASIP